MARSKKSVKKKPAAKARKPAAKAKKPAPKKAKAKKPAAKKKPAPKKAKAAKKPAAKARSAKAATAPPPPDHLAKLAIGGDLDVLFRLMESEPEGDRDAIAYKWLCVASDFGHTDADEMLGDLLESSSLRYDDDQLETGNAHWELGLAYLTGSDGLPRDLDKARSQLASAKERGFPMSVQEDDTMQAQARARLAPDALAVFDLVFSGEAPGRIDDRGGEGDEEDGG